MKRQFRGIWIPSNVWLNPDISVIEKFLYAEIHSFSSHDSSCYKSNKTLSEQFLVSESTIKRAVKNLELQGLIMITRTGRTRNMSALDLECMGQPDLLEGQNEPDEGQIDLPEGSNRPPSKTDTRTVSKTSSKEKLVMPFDTKEFAYWWEVWLEERKDRKYKRYTHRGEQAALHTLTSDAHGEEDVAIAIIKQSITHGWRGLFPIKESYGKKGISKNFDRDKLQRYLESLGDD